MMKLIDLPIYDPDPKRSAKLVQSQVIAEGRAARRLGVPLKRCPPFKDNDMAIDWRNGWRWEDEDIKARYDAAW